MIEKLSLEDGVDISSLPKIKGVVKWFSLAKGFGFVLDQTNGRDIFVHIEVLKKSGYSVLTQGDWIECTIETGSKGIHAKDIISVETTEEHLQENKLLDRVKFLGRVKWFDAAKGYGFIESDCGVEIFVGAKLLKSLGLTPPLRKDQSVKVSAERTAQGWVAQTVTFISDRDLNLEKEKE